MYLPSSRWTWAFVLVSLVQALIVLGFESYVFGQFQIHSDNFQFNDNKRQQLSSDGSTPSVEYAIPTFLALYIFGLLYQLVLVWDALRLKNTIQVIGLCLFNVALLIYAAVQSGQIHDQIKDTPPARAFWQATKPYLIAIPCILALGTCLMTIVARALYNEFAWTIYKHISADLKMKRRYLTFQIYITLLKFDFFFFLGFTIQFVVIINNNRKDPEFWLTIAAIPITIIILMLAGVFCRRESRVGMALIITLYFCALAYFIFKLVRIYEPSHKATYSPASKPLTTFAVITIILIICTIVNAIMCTLNFGHGLKPHITARKVNDPHAEDEYGAGGKWDQNGGGYGLPPRMEYGGGGGPGGGIAVAGGGGVGAAQGSRMTID